MKKEITIVGLALAMSLVLLGAGCAAGRQTGPVNANENQNANEITNETTKQENVNAEEPGVTEDDLNQLKSDINELEYENLNEFKN